MTKTGTEPMAEKGIFISSPHLLRGIFQWAWRCENPAARVAMGQFASQWYDAMGDDARSWIVSWLRDQQMPVDDQDNGLHKNVLKKYMGGTCHNGCKIDNSAGAPGPYKDDCGTTWCWHCFQCLYTFNCQVCGAPEHIDNAGRYIAVAGSRSLPGGIYRVLNPNFSFLRLRPEYLLRMGELPDLLIDDEDWGDICGKCSEQYEQVSPARPCAEPYRNW